MICKPKYYFEGIGGPHVGFNYIWPMSIIMRAFTSNNDDEIKSCLEQLVLSSAGTGFLHESFNKNNVNDYTRPWFAWVNTLFGNLIMNLIETHPHLILKPDIDLEH